MRKDGSREWVKGEARHPRFGQPWTQDTVERLYKVGDLEGGVTLIVDDEAALNSVGVNSITGTKAHV